MSPLGVTLRNAPDGGRAMATREVPEVLGYLPHLRPKLDAERAVNERPSRNADPRASSHLTVAQVGSLQRSAGNRAVGTLLARPGRVGQVQRLSWGDVFGVLSGGIARRKVRQMADTSLWGAAEAAVRASATSITIPPGHIKKLKDYALQNPSDGAALLAALGEKPSYYKGGWLLDVQSGAEAMVFGTSMFFQTDPPSASTFVHEMVHVSQYRKLGRTAFLNSYFGTSAAIALKRIVTGQEVSLMTASPLETAAYELEQRFKQWCAKHGTQCG